MEFIKEKNRIYCLDENKKTIAEITYEEIADGVFNINLSFGGTSLIIVAGVILETLSDIESRLFMRNYKGILGRASLCGYCILLQTARRESCQCIVSKQSGQYVLEKLLFI